MENKQICSNSETSAVELAENGGNTGFDWGSACDDGSGEFQQPITKGAGVEVGEIPLNKANVRVALESTEDVDIQLIDKATGTEIIAWPAGMLNGPSQECTTTRASSTATVATTAPTVILATSGLRSAA